MGAGLVLSEAVGETVPSLSPWRVGPIFSLCVCLCLQISPFLYGVSRSGLKPPPMTSIKFYLCEDPPLRSHCEVLGTRTATYEFGEGHNSTHNTLPLDAHVFFHVKSITPSENPVLLKWSHRIFHCAYFCNLPLSFLH